MDIYAQTGRSLPQKLVLLTIELVILTASGWILFGGGRAVLCALTGWAAPSAIPARADLIFAFSVVTTLRMTVTLFYLMQRRMGWAETFTIPIAFLLYYVGFAVLVLPESAALGLWDAVAVGLFVLGAFLNTGSELARDRFKKDPANRGRLYTRGLFALSRHINFFGDILWVAAYAIVAHTAWAVLIPLYTFCFFAFFNAPALDRHLARRYGAQYQAYARRSKMLIPFVW